MIAARLFVLREKQESAQLIRSSMHAAAQAVKLPQARQILQRVISSDAFPACDPPTKDGTLTVLQQQLMDTAEAKEALQNENSALRSALDKLQRQHSTAVGRVLRSCQLAAKCNLGLRASKQAHMWSTSNSNSMAPL